MITHSRRVSRGDVAGRLEGKVAVLTGVAGGQGREAALLFARAGAVVVGCDINADGLSETRELAREEGLSLDLHVVDATDADGVQAWIDAAAERHGGIDVLYNNGSATRFAPFEDMDLDMWRESLRLELDVVYVPTRAVWPHLVARGGGSIINIASISGMVGSEVVDGIGQAAHATGKSGIIGLTRQLAAEGAAHWIRVNTISPGIIVTAATESMLQHAPDLRRVFTGMPLLRRDGQPIDVVYTGVFLASDEAAFLTGVNIPVDGGLTARSGVSFHSGQSD